jgi:hypothetical protein
MDMLKRFVKMLRSLRSICQTNRARREPSRHGEQAMNLSPEQFRAMLVGALDDPATARLVAKRLLLPVFPVQGGACGGPAVSEITAGSFSCGAYTFLANSATTVPLTVKGAASQTADLQQWQDSAGTVLARMTASGRVGINKASPTVKLHMIADGSAGDGIRVEGNSANQYPTLALISTGASAVKQWSLSVRGGASGEFHLDDTTEGFTALSIMPSGRVGIKATSPQTMLDVRGSNPKATTAAFENIFEIASTDSTSPLALRAGIKTDATAGNRYGAIEVDDAGTKQPLALQPTSGNVGIGRTDPQATLHVKGGGITIEDVMGAGRLGFAETGENNARIVLYRGGQHCAASGSPDITILRNFPQSADSCVVWTILKIWAPGGAVANDREATLTLSRGDNDEEFMDVYNNGYTSETQYGIRIQKRGTGSYRDFAFDQFDGNANRTKLPIMTLKADRTVWLKSHGDLTNTWAGSDSIHATGAITTGDATQTTLFSLSLVNGRAYFISARVVARQSDGTNRAFYYRGACVYRETGSGSVLQGVQSIATIESNASLDCTIDVDAASNTARVRVTGLASATFYWVGTIEYQSVATSS